jgi:hypothetical protein
MSVSTLALDAGWRDHFAMWNALVEPRLAPLEGSHCHAPRFVVAPDISNMVIPTGGKQSFNFNLVPGSILWCIWPQGIDTGGGPTAIQLTDVEMGHKFFQEPVDPSMIVTNGSQFGRFPSYFLFPTPHPVVGDGLFTLDIWGAAGGLYWIVLGVAEVSDCNVK